MMCAVSVGCRVLPGVGATHLNRNSTNGSIKLTSWLRRLRLTDPDGHSQRQHDTPYSKHRWSTCTVGRRERVAPLSPSRELSLPAASCRATSRRRLCTTHHVRTWHFELRARGSTAAPTAARHLSKLLNDVQHGVE